MALIKTISEVKKYVRINYANAASSLPNMDRAERKYILPLLGRTLYEEVVAQYDASSTDEDFLKLLNKVQAALAPLAYWMELPLINTQITDIGLVKTSSADKQPVFKHDFYKVLQVLADQGMDELEELLAYLEENKAEWPTWVTGTGYADYTRFLIRTGKEFSDIFTLTHPRRCFLALSPSIRMVEDKYFCGGIGTLFFEEIKNKSTPSSEETTLLYLLKKAEVYLTIRHAVATLSVSLSDTGFTVQAADPDLADPNRAAADSAAMSKLQQEAEQLGMSYLADAIAYLNANATATIFPLYFSSSFYKNPNEQRPPLNSQLKSTYTL